MVGVLELTDEAEPFHDVLDVVLSGSVIEDVVVRHLSHVLLGIIIRHHDTLERKIPDFVLFQFVKDLGAFDFKEGKTADSLVFFFHEIGRQGYCLFQRRRCRDCHRVKTRKLQNLRQIHYGTPSGVRLFSVDRTG